MREISVRKPSQATKASKEPRRGRAASSSPRAAKEPAEKPPQPNAKAAATTLKLRAQIAESWAALLGLSSPLAPEAEDAPAYAALVGTQSSWLVSDDARRARARAYATAAHVSGATLLVGASVAELAREKARLASLGLPVSLLDAEGRMEPANRAGTPSRILLVPSEIALAPALARALERTPIARVVIDSAELLAERGHEIKPSYGKLPALLARLGNPPVHALSRPCAARVRREALERLGLVDPLLVPAPFVPERTFLDVRQVRGERRGHALLEVLGELAGPGVVLFASPHEIDSAFATLSAGGIACCRAHLGLPVSEREAAVARFATASEPLVLLTTSAHAVDSGLVGIGETQSSEPRFGFGQYARRAQLNFVVHHHAPATLEQYVRELSQLGHARETCAVLLYDSSHRSLNQAMLEQARLAGRQLEALSQAIALAATPRARTVEALALQIGQSRRTTERLVAVLMDAGLVQRTPSGLELLADADAFRAQAGQLAQRLESLRAGDAGRLSAVERFAESSDCKRRELHRYFGVPLDTSCGKCGSCRARERNAARPKAPAERGNAFVEAKLRANPS